MKIRFYLSIILTILFACVVISCERESFNKGQYRYDNQELIRIENGLMIQWGSDTLSDEIKDAVREIVTSMVYVDKGAFIMGTEYNPIFPDESPAHVVSLSDFYLGKVVVTQKQWRTIMGENPLWNKSYGKGENYPANFVSFIEAKQFIHKLNEYSGLQFRMPTEAEWEYAACGGAFSHFYDSTFIYSGSDVADFVAWHRDNSNGTMHPVATLDPNQLRLFDMSGNVWEWCSDWYGPYMDDEATDPIGPPSGTKHVVRGGSFTYEPVYARCKARNSLSETNQSLAVGLRLAISGTKQ